MMYKFHISEIEGIANEKNESMKLSEIYHISLLAPSRVCSRIKESTVYTLAPLDKTIKTFSHQSLLNL